MSALKAYDEVIDFIAATNPAKDGRHYSLQAQGDFRGIAFKVMALRHH